MSKKRVHELGKQLKEHGIELSNNELVDKLHALGYTDVKSHSSSLEDDQAATAYEKILAERKPKAAPPRPTGPGFVVRKRAHTEPVAAAPPPAPVYAAPPPEPEPAAAELSPAVEEAPALEPAAAPSPVAAPPLAASDTQPAPAGQAPSTGSPAAPP
ncbi:MAG TPA: translation initiation factor IF-2 N-terminal domain-containing protein, partial [Anaeromyxobacteraceae bacterium]|nr:translation initiation factor IF-2 N-terminal domain-containing protein [Anaeromyxobacteraceae bacterium]